MSIQCYIPRASLHSALIGGLFVTADGTRRLIPDHWLLQAELLDEGSLLRLSYTSCTIEVAGQSLKTIFEDASIGKVGAIHEAPPGQEAPHGLLLVTSIFVIAPPEAPALPFGGERSDA
jgi:hypothetical protein